MCPDNGAVDAELFRQVGLRRKLDEYSRPQALAVPAVEAVMDCGRRAVDRGAAPDALHLDVAAGQCRSSSRRGTSWFYGSNGSVSARARSMIQLSAVIVLLPIDLVKQNQGRCT